MKLKELKGTDISDFIMISDIHFGIRNSSEQWSANMENYFHGYFIPLLNRIKTDGSVLFVLGDIFDDRKAINISIINMAVNIFREIALILPVWIINGNHDIYTKSDNSISSLAIFSGIRNLHIIRKPEIIQVRESSQIKRLAFIPYQGDIEKETDLCMEAKDCDYIFMHTEIEGLRYDNGREIISAVRTAGINGKIYSGHIHKRQETKKATYIGSPYQLTRSDIGNHKGIYQVDLKTNEEKFYKNDFSPIFQKVKLEDLLEHDYKSIKAFFHNNYTDILIRQKDVPRINITRLYEALEPACPKNIEIKVIEEDIPDISDDENENVERSIPEIMNNLIENLDIENEEKEKLKTMSEKYYKMAESEND